MMKHFQILIFTLMFCVPAIAQTTDPNGDLAPRPEVPKAEKLIEKPKPAELARDLDGLFDQLKRTRNEKFADRISTRIWELWQTSDSRSIDLLSLWARNATGQRNFGRALDLMDQVVVMRPDYAEGYNQRATLHFFMRNFDKSIADIERVLALEPRHYGALSGLAGILEQIGEKEDALKTWYRTLSIYPAMKRAQSAVVRLEEELAGRGI